MTASRPVPGSIEGSFVRLEPLRRDLLPALFAAIGHPIVFAGGYGGGPAGYTDTEAGFAAFAERYYPWESGNPYAVFLRGGPHDGQLVGTSTLAEFEPQHEAAHLGWTAYDPRVWGTAVNPETKLLMLGLAFEHGFGRIRIQADAANARSRAAIAGIGAEFEGILRRDRLRADGTWRDTAVFSVIVDDWPRVKAGLEERLLRFRDRPVLFRSRG
ncbi:MAG TPA: GNAT family protein [Lacisediminihabitans sp.]|uniref:GNAT family N-acetyltransferase n=1 Tax=Lacisediminihabitans sp. TaxID=2787631 RepID=UPI002EDB4164